MNDSSMPVDLPKSVWRYLHDRSRKNFTLYLLPRTDKPCALRVTPYPSDSPHLNSVEALYGETHCVGTYEAGHNIEIAKQIFEDIEFLRASLKGEIIKDGE